MNCPKCQHQRTHQDDPAVPDYQCPKCGIIYTKYLKKLSNQYPTAPTEKPAKTPQQPEATQQPFDYRSIPGKIIAFINEEIEILKSSRKQKPAPLSTKPKPPTSLSYEQHMIMNLEIDKFKTNHILHLILSLFTAGFWLIIWAIVAASNTNEANKIRTKNGIAEEQNPAKYIAWTGILLIILTAFAFTQALATIFG